jgi:hypothetical protein
MRTARRFSIYLAAVALTAGPAHAQEGRSSRSVALSYLEEGMGARAVGLGQAYSALTEGADALFWNPAGLAAGNSAEILLNHQTFNEFMNLDVGSVAIPVGSSRIGAAYMQMKTDAIAQLDINGDSIGSFNVNDQLVTAAYARAQKGWSFGVAGKSIHSNLGHESASTIAADVGINFNDPFSPHLSHALVAQNMGRALIYGDQSSSLPTVVRLGTAFRPTEKISFGFDVISPKNATTAVAVGGELAIPVAKGMGLALRAGYDTLQKDEGGATGLGVGGGLSLSGLRLDFAWAPQNDFGASEIFTLTYVFGHATQSAPEEREIPAEPAAHRSLQVDVPPSTGQPSKSAPKKP